MIDNLSKFLYLKVLFTQHIWKLHLVKLMSIQKIKSRFGGRDTLFFILVQIALWFSLTVHEQRYVSVSKVSGAAPPRPGSSFAHFGFDEQLMHQIRKSEYTQPTPIQCQVSVVTSLTSKEN